MKAIILSLALCGLFSLTAQAEESSPSAPPVKLAEELKKDVKQDKEKLQKDREVRNKEQKDVVADKQKLKEDIKNGASPEQIATDKANLLKDKQERKEAQKIVNEDKKKVHEDREKRREHREARREEKRHEEKK